MNNCKYDEPGGEGVKGVRRASEVKCGQRGKGDQGCIDGETNTGKQAEQATNDLRKDPGINQAETADIESAGGKSLKDAVPGGSLFDGCCDGDLTAADSTKWAPLLLPECHVRQDEDMIWTLMWVGGVRVEDVQVRVDSPNLLQVNFVSETGANSPRARYACALGFGARRLGTQFLVRCYARTVLVAIVKAAGSRGVWAEFWAGLTPDSMELGQFEISECYDLLSPSTPLDIISPPGPPHLNCTNTATSTNEQDENLVETSSSDLGGRPSSDSSLGDSSLESAGRSGQGSKQGGKGGGAGARKKQTEKEKQEAARLERKKLILDVKRQTREDLEAAEAAGAALNPPGSAIIVVHDRATPPLHSILKQRSVSESSGSNSPLSAGLGALARSPPYDFQRGLGGSLGGSSSSPGGSVSPLVRERKSSSPLTYKSGVSRHLSISSNGTASTDDDDNDDNDDDDDDDDGEMFHLSRSAGSGAFPACAEGGRPVRGLVKKSVSFSEHVDRTHYESNKSVSAMHAALKARKRRARKAEQRGEQKAARIEAKRNRHRHTSSGSVSVDSGDDVNQEVGEGNEVGGKGRARKEMEGKEMQGKGMEERGVQGKGLRRTQENGDMIENAEKLEKTKVMLGNSEGVLGKSKTAEGDSQKIEDEHALLEGNLDSMEYGGGVEGGGRDGNVVEGNGECRGLGRGEGKQVGAGKKAQGVGKKGMNENSGKGKGKNTKEEKESVSGKGEAGNSGKGKRKNAGRAEKNSIRGLAVDDVMGNSEATGNNSDSLSPSEESAGSIENAKERIKKADDSVNDDVIGNTEKSGNTGVTLGNIEGMFENLKTEEENSKRIVDERKSLANQCRDGLTSNPTLFQLDLDF